MASGEKTNNSKLKVPFEEEFKDLLKRHNNLTAAFRKLAEKQSESDKVIEKLSNKVEALETSINSNSNNLVERINTVREPVRSGEKKISKLDSLGSRQEKIQEDLDNVNAKLVTLNDEYTVLQLSIKEKENKIDVTDRRVAQIEQNLNNDTKDNSQKTYSGKRGENISLECKQCNVQFENVKNMREHMNSMHSMNLHCNICSEHFSAVWKYEEHMDIHSKEKVHKCEHCGKGFHLQWRMNKHKLMHDSSERKVRKCHYYNNNKTCPFVEIGCKFLHEEAKECFFKNSCHYDKCQFRHQ